MPTVWSVGLALDCGWRLRTGERGRCRESGYVQEEPQVTGSVSPFSLSRGVLVGLLTQVPASWHTRPGHVFSHVLLLMSVLSPL